MSSAQDITRKAKSNLAIALTCLPEQRKQDMVVFYAFCRVIDDLADDLELPIEQRRKSLQQWREGIAEGFQNPDELQQQIIRLIEDYDISRQPFLDLIDGCSSDLEPQSFQTWGDLERYTYQVASCVGLVSIRIFGCKHPDSETYAVALGHALQITNILRDVHEDLDNGGRIYLPTEDLERAGLSEQHLRDHVHDERFISMMNGLADRAEAYYQKAQDHLRTQDAKALKAAEAMRKIYHTLLLKMRRDQFKVFDQRYSVSKFRKALILLRTMLP
ncbi:squalene/phytoene synthase family protein [Verrucomicrobiaceae bacterium N1E253]|uniref:Squalene/phytoene synthase family protein n=1 Tax=Oceaniferula marina TaxID=2748318 RepID=A0A851GI09_9BACT|nr:squalene/phytoene synthase family protein [Oceaniferula marina]NWK54855.1 squalene/phytoene synthase family protein [Oceaniferula marina]